MGITEFHALSVIMTYVTAVSIEEFMSFQNMCLTIGVVETVLIVAASSKSK